MELIEINCVLELDARGINRGALGHGTLFNVDLRVHL